MNTLLTRKGWSKLQLTMSSIGLLAVAGALLLIASAKDSIAQYIGFFTVLIAAGLLTLLGKYMERHQPTVPDMLEAARTLLDEDEQWAKSLAAMRIERVTFRDLSKMNKLTFIFYALFGILFAALALCDFAGIFPLLKLPSATGEILVIPHWVTGLVGLLASALCFTFLQISRISITDSNEEWQKLRKKFRLIVTDPKDFPQA